MQVGFRLTVVARITILSQKLAHIRRIARQPRVGVHVLRLQTQRPGAENECENCYEFEASGHGFLAGCPRNVKFAAPYPPAGATVCILPVLPPGTQHTQRKFTCRKLLVSRQILLNWKNFTADAV